MRVPLSGICTGFRIRTSGSVKDKSEYGFLDIIQPGTKDFDTTLTQVIVSDVEHINYFLTHYSSGKLKRISVLIHKVENSKELLWQLIDIYNLDREELVYDNSTS